MEQVGPSVYRYRSTSHDETLLLLLGWLPCCCVLRLPPLLTSAAGSSPKVPKLSSPDLNSSEGGWLVAASALLLPVPVPVLVVLASPVCAGRRECAGSRVSDWCLTARDTPASAAAAAVSCPLPVLLWCGVCLCADQACMPLPCALSKAAAWAGCCPAAAKEPPQCPPDSLGGACFLTMLAHEPPPARQRIR